jgi:CBS domain-containing protein
MLVSAVMSRNVASVTPDTPIRDAAALMAERGVGLVPVVTQEGRISGVLTDRDVAIRAATRERPPGSIEVAEVMTSRVVTCRDDRTIEEAANVMARHGVRRLCVANEHEELQGVLTLSDLIRKTGEIGIVRDTLERIAEGGGPPGRETGAGSDAGTKP